MRSKTLGDLRERQTLLHLLRQFELGPDISFDVLDTYDDVLLVFCHDLCLSDMDDTFVEYKTVLDGEGLAVAQVLEHRILVVDRYDHVLIFGMYKVTGILPVLSEEVLARPGNVHPLIAFGGCDLRVGIIFNIHIEQKIILSCKRIQDLVIQFLLLRCLGCQLSSVILLINVDDTEDEVIRIIIQASYHPQGMPGRNAVYHQTVFYALHAALLHGGKEIVLLDVLDEDVLVFFVYDLLAVADDVLKKVIPSLLKTERMESGVN